MNDKKVDRIAWWIILTIAGVIMIKVIQYLSII